MIKVTEKPENKEDFDSLKILAREIIDLLGEKRIDPIAYGSLIFFAYVKSSEIAVNDFDLLVNEIDMDKVIEALTESGVKFEYHKEEHTIHIEDNKVRLEIDSKDFWFKDEIFGYENYNFGGLLIRGLNLESLKKVYKIASENSDNKEENKLKYEILNKISTSSSLNVAN